jgi:hypothetical protein
MHGRVFGVTTKPRTKIARAAPISSGVVGFALGDASQDHRRTHLRGLQHPGLNRDLGGSHGLLRCLCDRESQALREETGCALAARRFSAAPILPGVRAPPLVRVWHHFRIAPYEYLEAPRDDWRHRGWLRSHR